MKLENESEKRRRERSSSPSNPTECSGSPDKAPRIFNIVVGRSVEDKTGGIKDVLTYEKEMREIAEEYSKQQKKNRPFVHMRSTKSCNRDLKPIGETLKGEKLYRVNLHGEGGGSVFTNVQHTGRDDTHEVVCKLIASFNTCEIVFDLRN